MLVDPSQMLLQFFPREMLNFDVPPAGMEIGPLHAIFTQVGQALANFQADALLTQAQLSVQQAADKYLDAHGVLYSTPRLAGETDTNYRARLLLLPNQMLTIAAISAAVTAYYATVMDPFPHVVGAVFDLQSDPATSATIDYVDPNGMAVNGLVKLDFVIAIVVQIPASLIFWAGRSFAVPPPGAYRLGNTYVVSTTPFVTLTPPDKGLVNTVNRTKAGGTNPVYTFTRAPHAHF